MKNTEISRVLKDGRPYKSHSFLLKVLPRIGKTKGKPAFIAGKKIFKTAVLRNKARRRAKAALVPYTKGLNFGFDLLFNLNQHILDASSEEINKEMGAILEKSGMLTK